MKITKIEQFFPRPRIRLVKVTTDAGIVGWGETTLEGKPKSTVAAVDEIGEYLIGKDPLRIEHHWQHIYRSAFFRGGNVVMTALSGLDQALWDIAGKYLWRAGLRAAGRRGARSHPRLRPLGHRRPDRRGLAAASERLDWLKADGGYKAFKAGLGGKWRGHEPPAVIDAFVERAYLMREWVGPEVELGLRLSRQADAGAGHRDLPRNQGHAAAVRRRAGAAGERGRAQAGLGQRALSHRHRRALAHPLGLPRGLRKARRAPTSSPTSRTRAASPS